LVIHKNAGVAKKFGHMTQHLLVRKGARKISRRPRRLGCRRLRRLGQMCLDVFAHYPRTNSATRLLLPLESIARVSASARQRSERRCAHDRAYLPEDHRHTRIRSATNGSTGEKGVDRQKAAGEEAEKAEINIKNYTTYNI